MFRWILRRRARRVLSELGGNHYFSCHDKLGLILVLAGEKKACVIEVDAAVNDPEEYRQFEGNVERLKKLLDCLGLVYSCTRNMGDFHGLGIDFESVDFWIGRSKNAIAPFTGIHSLRGADYHRTLGQAVDIPTTAVEAWVRGTIVEEDELPREVRCSDYYKFAVFRLSRDHWREELEVAKRRARIIRSIVPDLYNEIVDHA